jgi:hypothetical protein
MDLFEVIQKETNERIQWLKDGLAAGNASPEVYHQICGEIKGLLFVNEYVKDLKRQLENSDDE